MGQQDGQTSDSAMDVTRQERAIQTVRELQELIAALDRRVPHVERVGEIAIVRAAAALRTEALKRIEELQSISKTASKTSAASVPTANAAVRSQIR